ncbi:MAG: hypothetical protein K1X89_21145 [Myxococcaceae bacterium]|nr:hypothetical protein [Myxococcaceae bacterium]
MNSIRSIQGIGPRSPLEGQQVDTEGIVTAVDDKGFYLQEPVADLNQGGPAVYVFTGRRPTVNPGDDVAVSGKVVEFVRPNEREEFSDAPTTQLEAKDPAALVVRSSGNPVPSITIGKGGVQLSKTASNSDLWEKLESARVKIDSPVITNAPNDIPRYADLYALPNDGEGVEGRTKAGGVIRNAAGNPDAIPMRMPTEGLPAVNVGTKFKGALEGNVVQRHGHHQVTVWDVDPGKMIESPIKPGITTLREKFPDPTHVLFVASLNGENKDVKIEDVNKVAQRNQHNVDDDVGSGQLERMCQRIIENMGTPDIVAMQEIQDNDGGEISEEVDANLTWDAIVDQIVALGGPRYKWVDRPPENNKEGGMPGGNIRTGFLYNPDRVTLDEASVYRLADPAFDGSRKPLVATFGFTHGGVTEKVTLASVHNKSKRSGGEAAEAARDAQGTAINRWAMEHAPKGANEHIGVFGDRNAYTDEQSVKNEEVGGALTMLSRQLPETERYSTQFGGSSGELDHAAVKTSVPVAIDLVHVNADFDERFRSGDHDPTCTAWDFRRGQA